MAWRRGAVLAFVVALACALPGTAMAAYSDAACRTTPASWANDDCAGRQWGIPAVRAPQAWSTTRGRGAVVGVIDTGADFSHPDLRANLIRKDGANMLRNTAYVCPFQRRSPRARSSTAPAQDDEGHGTHVSGSVAAVTGNGLGVAGVAPASKVLPVKVLNADGEGDDERVAAGICFAVAHGARVINLSLGYDPVSSILVSGSGSDTEKAIAHAYSRGAAVLVAAGNEAFPACDFPASHTRALCVGAVDRRDLKAWYSNFGTNVGVVAPGGVGSIRCEDDEDVWSTMWPRDEFDCGSDGYDSLAGTSMATPHAAGVAALVKARFGAAATPDFIYSRLKNRADDLGPPGFDPVYGHGRVNANRAVR